MPEITPDFSEAQEEMGPMPAGVYKTRITNAEVKTSKKENKYISWKLNVFGAEGDMARYNNWPIYHSTMIAGPGSGMLRDFQKAVTGEVISGAFNTDDFLGKELEVTVVPGLDQDGQVSRWSKVKGVRAIQF